MSTASKSAEEGNNAEPIASKSVGEGSKAKALEKLKQERRRIAGIAKQTMEDMEKEGELQKLHVELTEGMSFTFNLSALIFSCTKHLPCSCVPRRTVRRKATILSCLQ